MEYIWIDVENDMVTKKNYKLKNSKEKKIERKEMAFWKGSNDFFHLLNKDLSCKKILQRHM